MLYAKIVYNFLLIRLIVTPKKKAEILKNYRVDKLGDNTIFIGNREFNFSYTVANSVVKDEFRNQFRYFGGLQCNYHDDSIEYKNLEKWLCEIAEKLIGIEYEK